MLFGPVDGLVAQFAVVGGGAALCKVGANDIAALVDAHFDVDFTRFLGVVDHFGFAQEFATAEAATDGGASTCTTAAALAAASTRSGAIGVVAGTIGLALIAGVPGIALARS